MIKFGVKKDNQLFSHLFHKSSKKYLACEFFFVQGMAWHNARADSSFVNKQYEHGKEIQKIELIFVAVFMSLFLVVHQIKT